MSAHDYALHILDDDEVAGRSAWSLDLQIFLGEERGAPRDPEFPRLRGVAQSSTFLLVEATYSPAFDK